MTTNQKPIYVVSNPAVDEAISEGSSWSLNKILEVNGKEAKDIHQSIDIELPVHRQLTLPFLMEYKMQDKMPDPNIDKVLLINSIKDRGNASILEVHKSFLFNPHNRDLAQRFEVYKNLGSYASIREGVRGYMESTNGQTNKGENIIVAPFGKGKLVWDYLCSRFGKYYNIIPFHEEEAKKIASRRARKADSERIMESDDWFFDGMLADMEEERDRR